MGRARTHKNPTDDADAEGALRPLSCLRRGGIDRSGKRAELFLHALLIKEVQPCPADDYENTVKGAHADFEYDGQIAGRPWRLR